MLNQIVFPGPMRYRPFIAVRPVVGAFRQYILTHIKVDSLQLLAFWYPAILAQNDTKNPVTVTKRTALRQPSDSCFDVMRLALTSYWLTVSPQ